MASLHAGGLTLGLGAILVAANSSMRGDAFVHLFIYLAGLLAMLTLRPRTTCPRALR
jgi:hypothetical protein